MAQEGLKSAIMQKWRNFFLMRFLKKIRNFAPTVTKTDFYEQNSTFYRREAGRSQKLRVQRELEKYAIIRSGLTPLILQS